MAEKTAKQGELVETMRGVVAPGRTVQADRIYGPGESIELTGDDYDRFIALGFLISERGTTRPLTEGPDIQIEGGASVTQIEE